MTQAVVAFSAASSCPIVLSPRCDTGSFGAVMNAVTKLDRSRGYPTSRGSLLRRSHPRHQYPWVCLRMTVKQLRNSSQRPADRSVARPEHASLPAIGDFTSGRAVLR